MNRWPIATLSLIGVGLFSGDLWAAEPPRVVSLRTQKVDGTTYFLARLDKPADLRLPTFDTDKPFSEADRRKFARFPRLVPQDAATRTVYYRHRSTQPALSFAGQATGVGKARFVLLYPLAEEKSDKPSTLTAVMKSAPMAEVAVELDFDKAKVVPVPKVDPDDQHIHPDDLRSQWALHQGAHFAALEAQVLEFGFYGFAREATGRKYGVVAAPWVRRVTSDAEHRLYEIATGADAIAETLQLHRMLQPESRPSTERTVAIADVPGVTVPEQPWDRLLAGKKPEVEPIAKLIPHDNYYLAFKSIRKFMEFGDWLDEWGTSAIRVYEVKSQDRQLRERYEKQLCLKSTALGKALGPLVVKSVAVTGHDPYVREGTDVTVIFHVTDKALFLAAVDGFIKEARKEHGERLHEGSKEYHGTKIEHFVTDLREVSLHRAILGDGEFAVYSNSPVGVRRVIDAHQGRSKRLADASDFRHLRTVFPLADKEEDGIVFLPDAFIRQLTGPASRIKEKRRLEALTSLHMVTNAAIFTAWETGKLPADHKAVLAGAGLRPTDIPVPEGKAVHWDADRQMAISDAYNTLHFATPLIELPIDKVTATEAQQYGSFRTEYEKLWRMYFDPIGLRLAIDDKRVHVETHILPLAASEQYQKLRQATGQGKFTFEPRTGAIVDFQIGGDSGRIGFSVDANAVLRDMVEALIRSEAGEGNNLGQEYGRAFWKMAIGISVRDVFVTDDVHEQLVGLLKQADLVKGEPSVSRHKNVPIHRVPISEEKYRAVMELVNFQTRNAPPSGPIGTLVAILPTREAPPALYVAVVDKVLHVSANEGLIKKLIEEAKADKKDRPGDASAGLYLSPANARDAMNLLLEYEGHTLALLNNQVLNCFYQAGLVPPDASESVRTPIVRRFLGYIPVSPDGSEYRYDARLGEVVNNRHGSHRRPDWHGEVAKGSELAKLIDQVKSLRADLQFLENGLHAVVTIERR